MKITSKNLLFAVVIASVLIIGVIWYVNYQIQKKLETGILNLENHQRLAISNIRTELICDKPNCFELAISLTIHIKKVIESAGYRDLATGNITHKERYIQTLFKASDFQMPLRLIPEPNWGRGPVDFILSNGKDKAQIEVKLATNTKLKHLKEQLIVYTEANGIANTVVPIVYFTQAQRVRAEKIINQIGISNNIHIIYIDADESNKPSGSYAKT